MPHATTRKAPEGRRSQVAGSGALKHGLVADALSSDILGGKYKVGDLLPSEPQLSQRFGVSRHTVRAALQTLHGLGLVRSHQGIGTQVQETRLRTRYSPSIATAEDLLQYATSTRVRVIDRTEIAVDDALAARFGCCPGERWWRVRTVRADPEGRKVVGYSEIHIPLAFGAVLDDIATSRQPIFALIEQRFDETIFEIRQDIACIARMKAQDCARLELPRNSPGMEITRRYLGRTGRLLEFTRSVHPAETFTYSMWMQLRYGTDL